MANLFIDEGFTPPWGVKGNVENKEVKNVLVRNINDIKSLELINKSISRD